MTRTRLALLDPDGSDDDVESFVAALTGTSSRYSPDQPRYPAGTSLGGQWAPEGGYISPITAGDTVPAKGREEIATTDPTDVDNLPPEYVDRLVAQMQGQFPGMTPEALRANIEAQLKLGMADPGNYGATWYGQAHDAAVAIGAQYGFTDAQAVGAVAAMSPQHEWGSNVAAAQFTAHMISDDPYINRADLGDDLYGRAAAELAKKGVEIGPWDGRARLSTMQGMEAAAAIKAYARSVKLTYRDDVTGKEQGVTWSCGLSGISQGVRILRGESPDSVLGGHKVRSFYDNIWGTGSRSVTVDTHAVSAALGQKVTAQDPRMGKIMAGPSSREYSTKGVYPLIADAYRRVAHKYKLRPDQVQAIVWLEWRRTHP